MDSVGLGRPPVGRQDLLERDKVFDVPAIVQKARLMIAEKQEGFDGDEEAKHSPIPKT